MQKLALLFSQQHFKHPLGTTLVTNTDIEKVVEQRCGKIIYFRDQESKVESCSHINTGVKLVKIVYRLRYL